MTRLITAIFAAVLLSGSVLGQKNSFETVNIMNDFWRFWERSETAAESEKVKQFREMVLAPHGEIFAGFTGERSDEEIAKYLTQVARIIPRMRKVNSRLGAEFPTHEATFIKAFPDMNWKGKVVFMPNYGITDSGTGKMNDVNYLVFGIDTIAARYGEEADLAALFHHELFHMYHSLYAGEYSGRSREEGEVPLYWLVWGEGLATYVSHRLNPNATMEQILLSKTLAAETEKILPRLGKTIRENIDSGASVIWKPFMSSAKNDSGVPPRSGYYIGYLIASEIGENMSLQKMSRLKGSDLRKRMLKVLSKIQKQQAGKSSE